MRWQAILIGVAASGSVAAHADCAGIDRITRIDPWYDISELDD